MQSIEPAKKRYGGTPKRTISKRARSGTTKANLPRGLHPGTYKFKRALVYEIDVKSNLGMPGSIACGDGKGVVWDWTVSLENLPNHQEFTNLFEQYRLTGVAFKIYPAWNDINSSGAANILMRNKLQRDGRSLSATNTELEWLEFQATQTHVMPIDARTPLTMFMRLNQLNKIYSGIPSGTEDYSVVSPKFISTTESATPHYGMQFRFDTMGGALASLPGNSGKFKMEACVYLECRAVK